MLVVNLEKLNAIIDEAIQRIQKTVIIKLNDGELDFKGLFNTQLYYIDPHEFIIGLSDEDEYLCQPLFDAFNDEIVGIYVVGINTRTDESKNCEIVQYGVISIELSKEQLDKIQAAIECRLSHSKFE